MFTSVETTIPAGTAASDPIATIIKLCAGTITSIIIRPAQGPRGEVYCKIKYRANSIAPQDEDEWIPLEEHPVIMSPEWSNWDGTYKISAVFCSPQARYDHIVDVDVEVLESPTMSQSLRDFIDKGF